MQQSVANFTTNNTTLSTDPNSVNGLGTYFNGLGWDQFYLPPVTNTTVGGPINIQLIHNNLDGNKQPTVPVTIITVPGGTAGLANGMAVTISGVTGGQNINGTYVINNVFQPGNSFALSILGNGSNDWSGGTVQPVQTTGIDVQKLAAGSEGGQFWGGRLPTSLDSMSPKNPGLLAIAEVPVVAPIKAHSIIPISKGDPQHGGRDGVVAYSSAHVDYVESEFIVANSHTCLDNPAAIEEVRRILHEHLDNLKQTAQR
jgi:hypothetical protein